MSKPLTEKETRRQVLAYCRNIGCEGDAIKIFNKYDELLRGCTNLVERDAISKLGIAELKRLLDDYEKIYVNGELLV